MSKPERVHITKKIINEAVGRFKKIVAGRLYQKGSGAFINNHETLGIITEEYYELIEAVKTDDDEKVLHELQDIGVACILGWIGIVLGWREIDK